ncbi:MAG TPA: hypothetical protein VIR33_01310 [Thermopolyspora sp.]
MAAAGLQTVLTVPARFQGPDTMANGGWIGGMLANALAGAGRESPVEVTLRRPVPLDTELILEHLADTVTLSHDDEPLADAVPVAEPLTPPPFVPFGEAARAEAGFGGLIAHPFPGCFVCGVRDPGDGLRVFAGPVRPGVVAAGWRVPVTIAGADGVVPDAAVWAALDCPTGWAHFGPGEQALLGRLTAQVYGQVLPGGSYSVVARASGRHGRKLLGESAVYETDGTLVAAARAVWIRPR